MLYWIISGCQPPSRPILVHTEQGDLQLRLFARAPRHAANFTRLVREKFYDSLLIHRVVQDFCIRTGDPDARVARPGMRLGNGDPGYSLPAEISALPLRGALVATLQAGQTTEKKLQRITVYDHAGQAANRSDAGYLGKEVAAPVKPFIQARSQRSIGEQLSSNTLPL